MLFGCTNMTEPYCVRKVSSVHMQTAKAHVRLAISYSFNSQNSNCFINEQERPRSAFICVLSGQQTYCCHTVALCQYKSQLKWFCNWMRNLISLRKHACSNILIILPPKNENFQIKSYDIFHISAQNIDCGYSLEPPHRGGSNEYPQSIFWAEIRKLA